MTFDSTWRDLAGFGVMAVCMTALAVHVLPGGRGTPPARRVLAAVAAVAAVVIARESGLLRLLHEDVFNRVEGEFDEFSTWIVALAGAIGGTLGTRAVLRLVRNRA